MSDRSRRARPEDVDALCLALPHVTLGTSWGDVPTYLVSDPTTKAAARGFCLFRPPGPTAIDPATGEPYPDLIVLFAPDAAAKQELVQAPGPFFDIPHFHRSTGVLVQASRLGEIDRAELAEVIRDSWRAKAPAALVRALDAQEDGGEHDG